MFVCLHVDVWLPRLVRYSRRAPRFRPLVAATHGESWPPRNPVAAGGLRCRNGVDQGDSAWHRSCDATRMCADLLAEHDDTSTSPSRREHASIVRDAETFASARASAEDVAQEDWMGILGSFPRF